MENLVIMKNQQAVTTSLQVAETFDKQHGHILRDVENLKKDVSNFGEMFLEGSEPDSYGRDRKVIYMNRDGFTLLAMGFTGSKAMQFKLKYIQAFNDMESHIKQELDTSNLSPELQMFNGLFKSLAKQELATKNLETKVDGISDIVALNTTDWRQDSQALIRKMGTQVGGGLAYQEIGSAIYQELDRRAACKLDRRLMNLRNRMAGEGASKTKQRNTRKLDVIANDKRLLEIYLAIVKEYAVKYKVWNDEF